MKAYRVITGVDATFQEAMDICRVLFSYHFGHSYNMLTLVTIHDEEEQRLIYSLVLANKNSHDQFWIGLKRSDYSGLAWVDGKTEIKYKNFAKNNKGSNNGKIILSYDSC